MDDFDFPFDLNDLFDTQAGEDDFLDLNSDLLSGLTDGDAEQFFDAQASFPDQILEHQDSVEHDHQYCGEQRRGRKRKLEESLFVGVDEISIVCLACHSERTDLNEQQICKDCQLTDDLASLYSEGHEENGRSNSESGEDNGYCSMAVASSPSSVSDLDSSSEQAVASPTVSQPDNPPVVRTVVTRGLPLLAYLPIPRLSTNKTENSVDASKPVDLTEEEKEVLKAEGLPIPTTWPLTKTEEKALRVVRRKLRNKMCAAVSRQRKKDYIANLEQKVEQCTAENHSLQEKVTTLESENRSLLSELRRVRNIISSSVQAAKRCRSTQTGTCLMVLVLCFALLLPHWPVSTVVKSAITSSGHTPFDYTTTTVSGRTLKFEIAEGDDGTSMFSSMYSAVASYFVGDDNYYLVEYQPNGEMAEGTSTPYSSPKRALTANTTDSGHIENVTLGDWISS